MNFLFIKYKDGFHRQISNPLHSSRFEYDIINALYCFFLMLALCGICGIISPAERMNTVFTVVITQWNCWHFFIIWSAFDFIFAVSQLGYCCLVWDCLESVRKTGCWKNNTPKAACEQRTVAASKKIMNISMLLCVIQGGKGPPGKLWNWIYPPKHKNTATTIWRNWRGKRKKACKCEKVSERDRHVGSINRLLCQHDGTWPATQGLNPNEMLHLGIPVLQWDKIHQIRHTCFSKTFTWIRRLCF